jgi:hypothetical protein
MRLWIIYYVNIEEEDEREKEQKEKGKKYGRRRAYIWLRRTAETVLSGEGYSTYSQAELE